MSVKRGLVALVLVVSVILTACGEDDQGAPIKLEKLSYEGKCSSYDLRVKFSGKSDHTHTVRQLEPGTDTVVSSAQWGPGGIFMWNDLACDADQPTWVEDENLCRYEIMIVSNNDPTLTSKRQSIEVKCQ